MEMHFAFDDDESASAFNVNSTSSATLKRQLSDESRSPPRDAETPAKPRTATDFSDLTFKDVDADVLQPSAAICIPSPVNDVAASPSDAARRRRKRRPLELGRPRRFDELYEATGEQLGAGAYSTVATFRDRRTQREFAVKRIEKRSHAIRARVFKEIEIFNACAGHPHVLQLIEFFETDKEFFLVFEKMYGGTLLHAIHERGHLSEAEARDVVRQIAEALSMLHKRGIAHRDLKPENILVEFAGQLRPVKIGDFDLGSDVPLARRSHTSSSNASSASSATRRNAGIVTLDDDDNDSISTPPLLTPVGSLEYMAPEVVDTWMGEASMYDKKCDIWSLGVILYILLSGKPPFYGQCGQQCGWDEGGSCYTCQTMLCERIQRGQYEFPERDWRAVSPQAVDLVRRMLVREPHRRASADEVLQHEWFSLTLRPTMPLDTPRILSRKASLAGLATYAENANAWNRFIAQQHNGSQFTVSCYLPSPRFDEQLSELLESETDAICAANGDELPVTDKSQVTEVQASCASGERARLAAAALCGARSRGRLPSLGAAQAARRRRLLSRSIDNSPTSLGVKRDGSPRLPLMDANANRGESKA